MTIQQAFETFRQRLELSVSEQNKASTTHTNVQQILQSQYNIYNTFLTGSYERNTKIRPLHDIDMFAVLSPEPRFVVSPPTSTSLSAERALTYIYTTLLEVKKRYPTATVPKFQDRSVNIEISGIGFDVVPAFYKSTSQYSTLPDYLVPDRKLGIWITSNPPAYSKFLSLTNVKKDKKLIPLIKMIKCWNRKNNGLIKSYHLERLILLIFHNKAINVYSGPSLNFFSEISNFINVQLTDEFSGLRIDNYLSLAERQTIIQNAKRDSGKATLAMLDDLLGKTNEAITLWREIFGDPFPNQ